MFLFLVSFFPDLTFNWNHLAYFQLKPKQANIPELAIEKQTSRAETLVTCLMSQTWLVVT